MSRSIAEVAMTVLFAALVFVVAVWLVLVVAGVFAQPPHAPEPVATSQPVSRGHAIPTVPAVAIEVTRFPNG